MKYYHLAFTILIALFFISCSNDEFSQKFSYLPVKPQPGKEITIKYKSESEIINNSAHLNILIHSYAEDMINTEKIAMQRIGEGWTVNYTPQENVKGLVIRVVSENGMDVNNELGYVVSLYDNKGEEIVGSRAGLANVYAKYSGAIGLTAAKDSASAIFEGEFVKNPELKREYLSAYLGSLPRKKRDNIIINELAEFEKNQDLTQKDLETLSNWYKNVKEFDKSDYYYQIILEKYPDSKLIGSKYYTRFRNMLTIERMLEVFNEFNTVSPESDYNKYMISTIVNKYVSEKKYNDAQKMLDKFSNHARSNVYNSAAWTIYEEKVNLKKAEDFCLQGIELARNEILKPSDEKPVYLDDEDWKNSKKNALAMILDTYGSVKKELGENSEALKLFEEAVELTGKQFPEINENYIALLYEESEIEKAKLLIEELLSQGQATDKMRNILNQIFEKEGGSSENFDEYIGKFDEKAKEKLAAKLREEMKNEPAPNFELLDLEGNSVKLSDLSGKTVIIDFWATWCGPCLQSFPSMKKAVNKYSDNSNVKFLFVNTWERVDDKKQNAVDFIKRSKYPFHVLLDDKNEVVEKYKVQGIPTKFILDGKGNIRFERIGFSGIESEVLEELELMIEMVN